MFKNVPSYHDHGNTSRALTCGTFKNASCRKVSVNSRAEKLNDYNARDQQKFLHYDECGLLPRKRICLNNTMATEKRAARSHAEAQESLMQILGLKITTDAYRDRL